MIHQLNWEGKDKVQIAIEKLQEYSRFFDKKEEGLFLAFSGGKDSVVCKALLDMAGVPYQAHYSVTGIDPPELVRFIKQIHPDTIWDKHYYEKDGLFVKAGDRITMWNLIPEKLMPPTRIARYCCEALKESSGDGHLTITGVRWAESANRQNNQGLVTIMQTNTKKYKELIESGNWGGTPHGGVVLVNDNEESRSQLEYCYQRFKTVLNPIIDWDDSDVWEFIREYDIPYCELYDKGYTRLGCLGCPMQGGKKMSQELEHYPKFKVLYIKAFDKMIKARELKGKTNINWETGEEVFKWWTGNN